MALDIFDAGWSGLRFVRRSAALRLLATVLVRDARYRWSGKVAASAGDRVVPHILQLAERYLEGNTAS
jgi:hypothetical protein